MMAEVFKVARKIHRRHDMVFDTIQKDFGERAFRRMLRVHYDPAIGAARPWIEHEDVYANLTSKTWGQVISQVERYQVPRALHETFFRLPVRSKPDSNVVAEAAPLMNEQAEKGQQVNRRRLHEAKRNKPVLQVCRDRYPNRVVPVSGLSELHRMMYKDGFIKRPVLSLQDPPTPRLAGTGTKGQSKPL